MQDDTDNALDYFAGGVPPSVIFSGSTDQLKNISELRFESRATKTILELAFIGLIGYFEAYCKDQFAAIINIAPFLLLKLSAAQVDTRIDPVHAVSYDGRLRFRVGFLISEQLDFGSAAKINALYLTLLGVSPFSRKNAEHFSTLLRDRNLLVHHGGILTSKYTRQIKAPTENAFFQSKVVGQDELHNAIQFLRDIERTMSKCSKQALSEAVSTSAYSLNPSAKKALEFLDCDI